MALPLDLRQVNTIVLHNLNIDVLIQVLLLELEQCYCCLYGFPNKKKAKVWTLFHCDAIALSVNVGKELARA